MKMIRIISVMMLAALIGACSSMSTTDVTMDQFKTQSEAQIYHQGTTYLSKHNYIAATKQFEALSALYPFGQYAEQGRVKLIYAYYKHDELAQALAVADQYIRLYPMGKYIDYAYYMKGKMQMDQHKGFLEKHFKVDISARDLSDLKVAFADFDRVVRHYPHSKYASDSKQRMIYIRNMLAKHDLEVAQYYYDNKAYVAAVNRAHEIVKHYQGTPSVKPAIQILINAYQALGLTKESADAQKLMP